MRQWIFPQVCLGCGIWGDLPLCETCILAIPVVEISRSYWDGRVLAGYVFSYDGVLKRGIHDYKFEGRTGWESIFSRLLVRAYPVCPFPEVAWWIPVPMHYTRRRSRGFDQVVDLFSPLLQSWGKCLTPILSRDVETPPLFTLKKDQRAAVLSGVFSLNPVFGGQLKGHRVVILDDILTSGSTVLEISKLLFECGVLEVRVITLAGVV